MKPNRTNSRWKQKARRAVLRHAVRSLTEKRASSPLVTSKKFGRLIDYSVGEFKTHVKIDLAVPMAPIRGELEESARFAGRPAEPRGPEGALPLWAGAAQRSRRTPRLGHLSGERLGRGGGRAAYRAAATALLGHAIKLHHGSLSDIFSVVPEQFDVAYFDACGPLFGGKPPTGVVLRELLVNQRMAAAVLSSSPTSPRSHGTRRRVGQPALFLVRTAVLPAGLR